MNLNNQMTSKMRINQTSLRANNLKKKSLEKFRRKKNMFLKMKIKKKRRKRNKNQKSSRNDERDYLHFIIINSSIYI